MLLAYILLYAEGLNVSDFSRFLNPGLDKQTVLSIGWSNKVGQRLFGGTDVGSSGITPLAKC